MDNSTEFALLRKLQQEVKAMFAYTGWDDCDVDAAAQVHKVEKALRLLDNFYAIRAAVGKSGGQK